MRQQPPVNTFVIVSGLPASGKTTLARALANALGCSHLDKDVFLEALLDGATVPAPDTRAALSRRADAAFQQEAVRWPSAVLSSWWRHPNSPSESGTPVPWLLDSGRRIIEVHCRCPAAEAVDRFRARKRHPGHLDALRSPEALRAQFRQAEALGPLLPGQAILFDTDRPATDERVRRLAREILRRLEAEAARPDLPTLPARS